MVGESHDGSEHSRKSGKVPIWGCMENSRQRMQVLVVVDSLWWLWVVVGKVALADGRWL